MNSFNYRGITKYVRIAAANAFYNAIIAITLFSFLPATAQHVRAKEGSFGVDTTNGIIVWHQKNLDSVVKANGEITDFTFGETFDVIGQKASLSHANAIKLRHNNKNYDLYISKLPIVQFNVDKAIKDNVKISGYLTYFFEGKLVKNAVGIEHRGNLSLTFPKKSYDLEFWTDTLQKKRRDLKFHGLKSDDDFILDGLYNEPLRLRSYIATKLWKDLHLPYYRSSEPKAKSAADVQYVELFKNGTYIGLYTLGESVARPLLELKKNEGPKVNGELFKAASYEGAPSFTKAPEYNDLFPHWAGFEMEYPIVDYKSHFKNISQLVNLTVNSDDATFAEEIFERVQMDNTIDYFLFVNLLRATDNLGKNYYLARYDDSSPYFFVPWDVDGVLGVIQDGKRIPTTDDILSNGLFDRLLKINPDGFRDTMKERWAVLRKTHFSDDRLFTTVKDRYAQMTTEKLYERELKLWSSDTNQEAHFEYINDWLKKRLAFLDQHFRNLPSSSEGLPVR